MLVCHPLVSPPSSAFVSSVFFLFFFSCSFRVKQDQKTNAGGGHLDPFSDAPVALTLGSGGY